MLRALTQRSHAMGVFMVALLWLAATGGLWTTIPLYGDTAVFVEYAVRVADGQVPHLDYYEVKPTGFVFAAWPFIQVGRLFDVPDWISARICSLTMLAALAAAFFVSVRTLVASSGNTEHAVRSGWIAALAVVALRGLPEAAAGGLQPKIFTVLCPVVGIALVVSGRPLLGGVVAAFTPFHWQPGALAWLIPLVVSWRRPAEEKALRRFLIGSACTVALYGGYLVATGSLGAFLDQTLWGAFSSVGDDARGARFAIKRIFVALWTTAGWELLIAVPLLAWMLWRRRFALWPLAVPVLIFGAWSLLDFQGTPDVIVLVLPLLMLAGAEAGLHLGQRGAIVAGAVLLLASLLPHSIDDDLTLAREKEAVADYLEAVNDSKDPIFSIGGVFLPLLAERPTIGDELFGYGLYARLEESHPAGAAGWIEDRLAEDPAGVVIGRTLEADMRKLLRDRIQQDNWQLLDTIERSKDINDRVVEVEIWVPESDRIEQ